MVDVMMASYHFGKGTSIFFILFIAFGIYYLMPIIFAVVYHRYHEDNSQFVAMMTDNRSKSLDFAFKQAVQLQNEQENTGTINGSTFISTADKLNIDYNEEKLYYPIFRILMKIRRPSLDSRRIRVLFNAICNVTDVRYAVKLNGDDGVGCTREQFQQFYKYVNIEIFRDPKVCNISHHIRWRKRVSTNISIVCSAGFY